MAAVPKQNLSASVDAYVGDLILTQDQIQEFEIPLDELTIAEVEGKSYGPIWLKDLTEAEEFFSANNVSYRYRKFGTEEWISPQEDADKVKAPLEQTKTIKLQSPSIKSGALPEPPLQGVFASSQDEVKRHFAETDRQETSNIDVMAELMAVKPTRREYKPEDHSTIEAESPAPTAPVTEIKTFRQEVAAKKTIIKKLASVAAGVCVVAIASVWGIAFMQDDDVTDSTTGLELASLPEESSSSVKVPSLEGSKNRTPASRVSAVQKAKDRRKTVSGNRPSRRTDRVSALDRSRGAEGVSAQDSESYEPPETAETNYNHDDGGEPINDDGDSAPQFRQKHVRNGPEGDDFQFDDGTASVEQDPLRKKLSPRTLEMDDTEERTPASDEFAEAVVDEGNGEATVDMSNLPEEF